MSKNLPGKAVPEGFHSLKSYHILSTSLQDDSEEFQTYSKSVRNIGPIKSRSGLVVNLPTSRQGQILRI